MLFDRFSLLTHSLPRRRDEPEWLAGLRDELFDDATHLNEPGTVLVGDIADGMGLQPYRMQWGMPNPWMRRKGLSPAAGTLYFMRARQAFAGETMAFARGLAPLTDIGPSSRSGTAPQLLTLPIVYRRLSDDRGGYGFCFIAEADSPLWIHPDDWMDWMNGWHTPRQLALLCRRLHPLPPDAIASQG